MENSSIENSSSLLSINVLDNNLKSNEKIKLENILEKVKDDVFNKELLEGESLLKINEFFLSLQQESSKAEGNLGLLKKFIKKYIKESPKNCQTSSYKTDIAYIFFAYQKGLSVQMVDNFIESTKYIKNKPGRKSLLVKLFLSNPDNQKENAFSFLLKNLTADNFTKDTQSRRRMIHNFAENPLYQEELKELFIGSNLEESKQKYNNFFSDFEKNYKNDRQDNLKRKDFSTDNEYIMAVTANNKSNLEILDKTYLSSEHYNEMSAEGIFGIESASSNMTIMGRCLTKNLDEIIKASTGCQRQDLNDCVSLERFLMKESEIKFTSIKKNSIASKDFLIIEVNQDTANANFVNNFKLIIQRYKPSVHGVKIILQKIKPIGKTVADISLADLGEIDLYNQNIQKEQIKTQVNDFNKITFINYRVAIDEVPKNENCEDLILLFKNSDHKEPVVIIDDTTSQLKEIKEIIDYSFENVKNKKVKLEVDKPKNYQLIHKKLAYILKNNDDENDLNKVVARIFGNNYSIEKLKIETSFNAKQSNGDAPYNQISNISVGSTKLSTQQVARD
jgi:hypothetical protein